MTFLGWSLVVLLVPLVQSTLPSLEDDTTCLTPEETPLDRLQWNWTFVYFCGLCLIFIYLFMYIYFLNTMG